MFIVSSYLFHAMQSKCKTSSHKPSHTNVPSPTTQQMHTRVIPKTKNTKSTPVPVKASQAHSAHSRAHAALKVEKKKSETCSQKTVHKQVLTKVQHAASKLEQATVQSTRLHPGKNSQDLKSTITGPKDQLPKNLIGQNGHVTKNLSTNRGPVSKTSVGQKEQPPRASLGVSSSVTKDPASIPSGLSGKKRLWSSNQNLSSKPHSKSHSLSSRISLAQSDSHSSDNIPAAGVQKVSVR